MIYMPLEDTSECHSKMFKLTVRYAISLSTLVLNSRDRYEKNGYRILRALKHTLK